MPGLQGVVILLNGQLSTGCEDRLSGMAPHTWLLGQWILGPDQEWKVPWLDRGGHPTHWTDTPPPA